jgi:hypothetical protein
MRNIQITMEIQNLVTGILPHRREWRLTDEVSPQRSFKGIAEAFLVLSMPFRCGNVA